MLQTYEAVLRPDGSLQFLDLTVVSTLTPRRVLVTFIEEFATADTALCGATLSESALAQDWTRVEEGCRMGPFAVRQIVLLPFPFSYLTASFSQPMKACFSERSDNSRQNAMPMWCG